MMTTLITIFRYDLSGSSGTSNAGKIVASHMPRFFMSNSTLLYTTWQQTRSYHSADENNVTLNKIHYANTPMQYTVIFHG